MREGAGKYLGVKAIEMLVFAIGQTIGPVAAGALGDAFGDIGPGIASAGAILALGAGVSLLQRPLDAAAG